VSRITETVQAIVACVFVAVFWFFFSFNWHKHFQSSQDAAIVLVFCIAMTVIFVWRLYVIVTMPESIELNQSEMIFRSLFGSRSVAWTDFKSLDKPLPMLPEGLIVRTKRGNIFVGSGLDASDEMQEIMVKEVAQVQQDLAFIAAAKKKAVVFSVNEEATAVEESTATEETAELTTEGATEEATEGATEGATEEATEGATEEATEGAMEEAMEEAKEARTKVATEASTEASTEVAISVKEAESEAAIGSDEVSDAVIEPKIARAPIASGEVLNFQPDPSEQIDSPAIEKSN
jgi:hypothetical protein